MGTQLSQEDSKGRRVDAPLCCLPFWNVGRRQESNDGRCLAFRGTDGPLPVRPVDRCCLPTGPVPRLPAEGFLRARDVGLDRWAMIPTLAPDRANR
jgi:hypothetical protein